MSHRQKYEFATTRGHKMDAYVDRSFAECEKSEPPSSLVPRAFSWPLGWAGKQRHSVRNCFSLLSSSFLETLPSFVEMGKFTDVYASIIW